MCGIFGTRKSAKARGTHVHQPRLARTNPFPESIDPVTMANAIQGLGFSKNPRPIGFALGSISPSFASNKGKDSTSEALGGSPRYGAASGDAKPKLKVVIPSYQGPVPVPVGPRPTGPPPRCAGEEKGKPKLARLTIPSYTGPAPVLVKQYPSAPVPNTFNGPKSAEELAKCRARHKFPPPMQPGRSTAFGPR